MSLIKVMGIVLAVTAIFAAVTSIGCVQQALTCPSVSNAVVFQAE